MPNNLKFAQNEHDDANQASTVSPRPKLLAKPYPAAFQQLLDSVANGEGLPQSVLDLIEENTKMLTSGEHANKDVGAALRGTKKLALP